VRCVLLNCDDAVPTTELDDLVQVGGSGGEDAAGAIEGLTAGEQALDLQLLGPPTLPLKAPFGVATISLATLFDVSSRLSFESGGGSGIFRCRRSRAIASGGLLEFHEDEGALSTIDSRGIARCQHFRSKSSRTLTSGKLRLNASR
jgi:hypothetical protein